MPPIITEERPSTEERVSRIEGAQTHLATKADVAELRGEVLAELAKSEARTSERIAKLHAEVIAELARIETRNVRWLIAVITVAVAVITIIYRLAG